MATDTSRKTIVNGHGAMVKTEQICAFLDGIEAEYLHKELRYAKAAFAAASTALSLLVQRAEELRRGESPGSQMSLDFIARAAARMASPDAPLTAAEQSALVDGIEAGLESAAAAS